jgi:hypothetical protein
MAQGPAHWDLHLNQPSAANGSAYLVKVQETSLTSSFIGMKPDRQVTIDEFHLRFSSFLWFFESFKNGFWERLVANYVDAQYEIPQSASRHASSTQTLAFRYHTFPYLSLIVPESQSFPFWSYETRASWLTS